MFSAFVRLEKYATFAPYVGINKKEPKGSFLLEKLNSGRLKATFWNCIDAGQSPLLRTYMQICVEIFVGTMFGCEPVKSTHN